MTVYLYAVTEEISPVPTDLGQGLQGQTVRAVASSGLMAVVSDHRDGAVRPSEADLWAHERVVEGLMADRAVLPMRFGSLLADDAAARALLSDRAAELRAALRHVAGAIELGVRVAWSVDPAQPEPEPEPKAAGDASGSAYLMGQLSRRRRARRPGRPDRSAAGRARTREPPSAAAHPEPAPQRRLPGRPRASGGVSSPRGRTR